MHVVKVRVSRRELSERMAAMRLWLDEHRFEPSTFTCQDVEEDVLVRIDFKVPSEARAFAARFGGRLAGTVGEAESEADRDILPLEPSRGLVG
ncbi:MAG TPA: hypothetical protein VJ770_13505 [Stellaceae bacterium]|nr:hypothetical protein [Stellaceae bacterium]